MHFDACLTIANFKLGTDPNNIRALTLAVGVQGGYAVILNYERSPEAVRYAADAADLLGRLSELQPKDTAAKREHAVGLWRLAGLLMAARPPEFKRSLIAAQEALNVITKMEAENPLIPFEINLRKSLQQQVVQIQEAQRQGGSR